MMDTLKQNKSYERRHTPERWRLPKRRSAKGDMRNKLRENRFIKTVPLEIKWDSQTPPSAHLSHSSHLSHLV
jgi:hypothetical protein